MDVTRWGLVTVDGREGSFRSVERLAKEKVDASECRIEALLLRDPVAGTSMSMSMSMGGGRGGRGLGEESEWSSTAL